MDGFLTFLTCFLKSHSVHSSATYQQAQNRDSSEFLILYQVLTLAIFIAGLLYEERQVVLTRIGPTSVSHQLAVLCFFSPQMKSFDNVIFLLGHSFIKSVFTYFVLF